MELYHQIMSLSINLFKLVNIFQLNIFEYNVGTIFKEKILKRHFKNTGLFF